MKRILLIMPYGSVGGMERLALNFYNHYKDKGYTVKAIKIIQLESDIIHFGIDEIALSKKDFNDMSFLKRLLFYIKLPFLIRKIIIDNSITHSISFGDMANVFSSISCTKEYKIASIHALKSVEFLNRDILNKVFKFAFKSSYYFFNKVVCISEAIKTDLIEKCAFKFPKKLIVIYNPHDVEQIDRLSKLSIESKEEKELFSNNNVILFLGRISIQKAPWHLIKAFSLLENEGNTTKLVLIGDGDLATINYLKKLIDKFNLNENVVFLGRKSNPYQYLRRSKILCLTSYYEGTPNVIVEAIATETPVVASNCTQGIVELMSLQSYIKKEIVETESGIITPNFFKGVLKIPVNDEIIKEERVFTSALKLVLNDEKYQKRLLFNKEELLKKFNLENVANQYLN